MTDKPLDLDDIERDLLRQLDRTRRIPTEPLVSLTADDLRGLIAAARERDVLKSQLAEAIAHQGRIHHGYSLSHAAIVKSADDERDALKAKLDRAREAAVIAVTPLEAMALAGILRTFRPDVRGEIQRGIEAVRAILADLDADQPKEG